MKNTTFKAIGFLLLFFVSSCSVLFNTPYQAPLNVYLPETQSGFFRPFHVAKAGSKFLVSDSSNSRVLIYNSEPAQFPATPDVVIGQINTSYNVSNYPSSVSASSIGNVNSIVADETHVVVPDLGNSRVLIWNSIPIRNFQPADVVLGQPDFTSNQAGTSSTLFKQPRSAWLQNGKLYVADTGNHRVLIYNSIPTQSTTPPDFVLGQSSFNTATSGRSSTAMSSPFSVFVQGGNIFVADTANARVMVWTNPITANNQPADLILGATNFTNAGNINWCTGVGGDGTKIYAVSFVNSQIRVWNSLPGSSSLTQDFVLGQPNTSTGTCNTGGVASASTFCNVVTAFSDGTKLYAADQMNNRVLVWNTIPTTTQQAADLVLGQPSMSRTALGGVDMTDPKRAIHSPYFMEISGGKFFVTSFADHRVMVWNQVPTDPNSVLPDFIVGQPDLTTNQQTYGSTNSGNAASAQGLAGPSGIVSDGNQLYVSEISNPRVLIFNPIPTGFLPSGSGVLGETNFTNRASGTTASLINSFNQMAVSGQNLFGTDTNNNRVLIWNPLPSGSSFFAPANLVLGQPDFTSNSSGASAYNLKGPKGIATDGVRLIVSDTSNHRVLIWNSLPAANQQPADLVLGQPDMNSNSENNGGLSSKSLRNPFGVWTDGKRLVVVDSGNHRVLLWKTFPTSNYAPASAVYGQFDFFSNNPNYNGITTESLSTPVAALIYQSKLYISDSGNHRIVVKTGF